jgi:hypothetical protein
LAPRGEIAEDGKMTTKEVGRFALAGVLAVLCTVPALVVVG